MKRNGKNGRPLLAGLVIPGIEFTHDAYASLKLRLDCYDDMILARKFKDGQGGAVYTLDPLHVAAALAGMAISTPLLPPGCLFWQRADGVERLAIYAGPQVWTVHVYTGPNDDAKRKRGKRQTWHLPMPGLVWLGQGLDYRLWAVKSGGQGSGVGGQWPGPETELFRAPCPNVDGGICRGNVEFPAASAATIRAALELFFESDFNAHLSNGKSRKYKDGVLEMWRELHQAGAEAWPEEDLVSAGKTLGQVMGGLSD